MINFKNRFIFILIIVFLAILGDINGQDQSNPFENKEKELKKYLQYDNWPGKNYNIRNGINLSNKKILALSDSREIKPKNLFFISYKKNGEPFVKYCSQWEKSKNDFVKIIVAYLNSGYEAQEYLFDNYLLETSLPFNLKKNSIDTPSIVGDMSFFKGGLFIRDNIIVNIHAEGIMSSRVIDIAKEIDELLMAQIIVQSYHVSLPRLVKDITNRLMIVEP